MPAAQDWTLTFVLQWLPCKTNQRQLSRISSTLVLPVAFSFAPLHRWRTAELTSCDCSTCDQQHKVKPGCRTSQKSEAKAKYWYLAFSARRHCPGRWQNFSSMNYFLSSITDRRDLHRKHTSGREAKSLQALDRDKCDSQAEAELEIAWTIN